MWGSINDNRNVVFVWLVLFLAKLLLQVCYDSWVSLPPVLMGVAVIFLKPTRAESGSLAFVNEERSWKAWGRTLRYVNTVSLPLGGLGVFTAPVQTCSVTYFQDDSQFKLNGHFSLFRGSQLVLSHTHTNPGFLRKRVGFVYLLHIPCFRCSPAT